MTGAEYMGRKAEAASKLREIAGVRKMQSPSALPLVHFAFIALRPHSDAPVTRYQLEHMHGDDLLVVEGKSGRTRNIHVGEEPKVWAAISALHDRVMNFKLLPVGSLTEWLTERVRGNDMFSGTFERVDAENVRWNVSGGWADVLDSLKSHRLVRCSVIHLGDPNTSKWVWPSS